MADPSDVDEVDEQKPVIKEEKGEGSKMSKEPDSPRKSSRLLNSKPNNILNSLKKRKRSDTGSDSEKEKAPKRLDKNQNSKTIESKPRMKRVEKRTPVKKARESVKQEKSSSEDEDEEEEEEEEEEVDNEADDEDYKPGGKQEDKFGPAMLGLHRIGDDLPAREKKEPIQLNRRGMPQRIRKKNPLFFDDTVVNHLMPKQRNKDKIKEKGLKNKIKIKPEKKDDADQKIPAPVTDKKIGQKIGLKLRNLLKLPKAQKWVCYEWFYSNIDRVLFYGRNDFLVCLRESFPQLRTTSMARIEWCQVRRLMGKPRRCSQAFFEEERQELDRRRTVIRQLQQRKMADVSTCKDLPDKVPMQLTIGQKVTARLRTPQDGLFTGTIDAVDTSDNTYRITFERHGLGTHSVPDYEVLSNEEPGMFSLSTFIKRYYHSQMKQHITLPTPRLQYDAKAASEQSRSSSGTHSWKYDTYPSVLIEHIVRLQKILQEKRAMVDRLQKMNTEAEEKKSNGGEYPERFRRNYAGLVVEFHRLNSTLEAYLNRVQKLCHTVAPESSKAAMLAPSYLRDKSKEEAQQLIDKYFKHPDKTTIKNRAMVELVTSLVALMIQVKSLSGSDRNVHELTVLKQSMAHIKKQISPKNQDVFQDRVEIHMQFMESGLGPYGTLTPFSKQRSSVV